MGAVGNAVAASEFCDPSNPAPTVGLVAPLSGCRAAFPGRVALGTISRADASASHYMVWGANSANCQGADGAAIVGAGQAAAMGTRSVATVSSGLGSTSSGISFSAAARTCEGMHATSTTLDDEKLAPAC